MQKSHEANFAVIRILKFTETNCLKVLSHQNKNAGKTVAEY